MTPCAPRHQVDLKCSVVSQVTPNRAVDHIRGNNLLRPHGNENEPVQERDDATDTNVAPRAAS